MNRQLQKKDTIDASQIDVSRYTETLMAAAYEAGLYDDDTVIAVRGALFDLLAQRLETLTKGESCSVPAETAQAMLGGVLYTLDLCLLGCPTHDGAAMRLAKTPASTLYEEGLACIRRKLRAAELQYRRYLPLFRALPDSVMKTTAVDGIAGFFRAYHPEGFADDVPITADYPLYLDGNAVRGLRGVTFLGRYLQGLTAEARFLGKFRAETLHAVLSAADPLYHETPSNLFAPMLATVLGMALLGRSFSAWKFGLGRGDIAALETMYDEGGLTRARMAQAAELVIDRLMADGTTADYITRAAVHLYDDAEGVLRRHLPMLVFPCTENAVSTGR